MLQGELLAEPEHRGARLHAPASGEILSCDDDVLRLQTNASAGTHVRMPPLDADAAAPELLRQRIGDAGIVGLGGGGFPTAEKLANAAAAALLIVNGAECEPGISCDDALIREQADEVLRGAMLLARSVNAGRCVLALTDRMDVAREALQRAQAAQAAVRVDLVAVPAIYPVGSERQLIETLIGRQVPRGGQSHDNGVVVCNVATAAAAWRAVALGEALTHRIVSLAGAGVVQPGNFRVAIGTPIAHLIAQAGGYQADAARLLLGSALRGEALPHDAFGIEKHHRCVLVLAQRELPPADAAMPCLRCGDCADVCPARLQPQWLYRQLQDDRLDRAQADGLPDCIECGACDLVCPSHIALTQQFRAGKSALLARAAKQRFADAARARYEARNARLQRESAERAAQAAERAQRSASADAVAAAIERAKARRQATKDDGT